MRKFIFSVLLAMAVPASTYAADKEPGADKEVTKKESGAKQGKLHDKKKAMKKHREMKGDASAAKQEMSKESMEKTESKSGSSSGGYE
ncbi:hypothetical protein RHDC2_00288 [Rhodocyclaceae bacterium]|nr:hypothetical protein RHDC2_00288 [Rhodocyclaceae bacterium]